MTDVLLQLAGGARPRRIFPASVRQVLKAIRAGRGGALFPPVIRGRSVGVATVERMLGGEADAGQLASALADPRFAPLLDMFEALDAWCVSARQKHAALASGRLFSVANAALFGALTREVFVACAAADAAATQDLVRERLAQFLDFLELFFARFGRDAEAGVFARRGWHASIRALETYGDETHNGGQRVLRVQLPKGVALAYKPRPADGERLFLAVDAAAGPASIFGFLNACPPASGIVRLPLLDCFGGSDRRDRDYSWQEWLPPPSCMAALRRHGRLRLLGPRLAPAAAQRFWHEAGALSAVAFGFGVVDLGEENLLVGQRRGAAAPMAYPVDLEIYFAAVTRLHETGLVASVPDRGLHHVGFEKSARWCTTGGPPACFEQAGGSLRLRRMHQAWGRTQTRNVVGDTRGRFGYAAYLAAYLRGMFDGWTLACRERDPLARLVARISRDGRTRVLLKPTVSYGKELERRQMGGGDKDPPKDFSAAELAQLARGDAPYFFRAADGGPLLELAPAHGRFRARPAGAQASVYAAMPVDEDVRACRRFDLAGLGIAVRDAVAYVYEELAELRFTDREHGVHVHLSSAQRGEIGFDWPEVGQRVIYAWTPRRLRLRLQAIEPRAVVRLSPALRHQLLRLERVDAVLREPWAKSNFTDEALCEQLDQLTAAAADWFRGVLDEHGWPGVSLVGQPASRAAARLAQHLGHTPTLQRRCLRLLRRAAEAGEAAWSEVAMLTDAIRLGQGRAQLYGSKFERVGDSLRPCPIERPEQVDRRRREFGLEPLQDYARRLQQHFLPVPEASA